MTDANLRVPEEVRDRLAAVAAAEGHSLRSYLTHLAQQVTTPTERAERAARARAVLRDWTGYDPTPDEEAATAAELDRRLDALPTLTRADPQAAASGSGRSRK
jgi:hypothetical protein